MSREKNDEEFICPDCGAKMTADEKIRAPLPKIVDRYYECACGFTSHETIFPDKTEIFIFLATHLKPDKTKTLEDALPLIELFHHLVRAGLFAEALVLYDGYIGSIRYPAIGGLSKLLFRELHAYDLHAELIQSLLDAAGPDLLPRGRDMQEMLIKVPLETTYLDSLLRDGDMQEILNQSQLDIADLDLLRRDSRMQEELIRNILDTADHDSLFRDKLMQVILKHIQTSGRASHYYAAQSRYLRFLNDLATDLSLIGQTCRALICYYDYLSRLLHKDTIRLDLPAITRELAHIEKELEILFDRKSDHVLFGLWFSKNILVFARNMGMCCRAVGDWPLASVLFQFYNRVLDFLNRRIELFEIMLWKTKMSKASDINDESDELSKQYHALIKRIDANCGYCLVSIARDDFNVYLDLIGVGDHELARLFSDLGDFEKADEHLSRFRQALDFFEYDEGVLTDKRHLYWAYLAYCTLLKVSAGHAEVTVSKALEYAKKALEFADKSPFLGFRSRNCVRGWYLMARCLNNMGQYDEALSLIEQAATLTRKHKMVDFESSVLLEQAICYYETGHTSEALEVATQALEAAVRYRFVYQEVDAHSFLSYYYKCTGDNDRAVQHAELTHLRARQKIDCTTGDYVIEKDDKWHYKSIRYKLNTEDNYGRTRTGSRPT